MVVPVIENRNILRLEISRDLEGYGVRAVIRGAVVVASQLAGKEAPSVRGAMVCSNEPIHAEVFEPIS